MDKPIVRNGYNSRLKFVGNLTVSMRSTMNVKKLVCLSALASSLMFQSNLASASIEDALANICNIVIANDKSELRKKIKNVQNDFRVRLDDYYEGITCGGNSLIRTAILNNAVDAGELLVKRLPRTKLQEPEKDGVALANWIDANGFSDSPIAAVVKDRI